MYYNKFQCTSVWCIKSHNTLHFSAVNFSAVHFSAVQPHSKSAWRIGGKWLSVSRGLHHQIIGHCHHHQHRHHHHHHRRHHHRYHCHHHRWRRCHNQKATRVNLSRLNRINAIGVSHLGDILGFLLSERIFSHFLLRMLMLMRRRALIIPKYFLVLWMKFDKWYIFG